MLFRSLQVLNWYNIMCTPDEAREYISDYLKANDRKDELKKLSKVADTWVPTTVAWICRLLSRGYPLSHSTTEFMERELKQCLSKAKVDDEVIVKDKVNVQDRMREKVLDVIGEIEAVIDSGEELQLYDWLKANETPVYAVGYIVGYYSNWLTELIEEIGRAHV